MSNTPSVAVIGCGYWGKNLVRNFSELGHLSAICDPLPEHADPLSERFDVPVRSYDDILADNSIPGISIASPAPMHVDMAKKALNAGKHVMVEKPVALSIDEARELVDLAKEKDRLLMVGHLLNYHSGFQKVVELVQSGRLGKLRQIYSNRLTLGKIRTEENVLWSFAPHDLSMILRLAGGQSPTHIAAFGADHVTPGIHDFCHVHMAFPDDLKAHVFVSWRHPYTEKRLVVIGDDAMVVFDDLQPNEQKVAFFRHQAGIVNGIPTTEKAFAEYQTIDASEPLKNECQAFLDGMSDRSSIYTDGEEGLRVLDALSRADTALKT